MLPRYKLYLQFFVFAIVFICTANWQSIRLLITSSYSFNEEAKLVNDQALQQFIFEKTGVENTFIKIADSQKPYAAMIGIPGKPVLVLSRIIYEDFEPSAREYVLLHEMGHYVLWHTPQEVGYHIIILVVLACLLWYLKPTSVHIIAFVFAGFILGLGVIQLTKQHEYEADNYALGKVDDPQGMILATDNFIESWGNNYLDDWKGKIFFRSVPYSKRIERAKEYLQKSQ